MNSITSVMIQRYVYYGDNLAVPPKGVKGINSERR